MLTQLSIQGLAIIDSLSIEFSHGFNVITGETGAGKSILIKALGLLLGGKAAAETVRRGRESATVSGLFEAPKTHRCGALLAQYGIPTEPKRGHMDILVRRTVSNKGRSLAWINDVPVTAGVLREVVSTLIDVFGQHDNQRLLDAAYHTVYLDQFVNDRSVLTAYQAAYRNVQEGLNGLVAVMSDLSSKRRDADYLEYRCNELAQFAPSADDHARVAELCRRASRQLATAAVLERAQACIDTGAGGEPLSRPLWEFARLVGRLDAPEAKALADEALATAARLDDLSFAFGQLTSGFSIDEADLERAQARLSGYQDLFRKLAVADIDGLLAECERLEGERTFLQSAATEITTRLRELKQLAVELGRAASKLGTARDDAKRIVKRRVESELHELVMPGAVLEVELTPAVKALPAMDFGAFGIDAAGLWTEVADLLTGMGEHGAERAQFLLASNPGEALLPLQKAASGGEVSRIMLALKRALAAGADACVLVFDEIDTGISGRVADVVGRKMQDLAGAFQVICISHLAQVAAYADTHFVVQKYGKNQRTESSIVRLSSAAREEEVARLLSGQEVTASSLANARQLIRKARGGTERAVVTTLG